MINGGMTVTKITLRNCFFNIIHKHHDVFIPFAKRYKKIARESEKKIDVGIFIVKLRLKS